jgi:hypothetical protein
MLLIIIGFGIGMFAAVVVLAFMSYDRLNELAERGSSRIE